MISKLSLQHRSTSLLWLNFCDIFSRAHLRPRLLGERKTWLKKLEFKAGWKEIGLKSNSLEQPSFGHTKKMQFQTRVLIRV